MTPEEKQDQLARNWAEFQAEAKRMESEGKAIGTFSSWCFANNKVSIKIALTREEHFGKG